MVLERLVHSAAAHEWGPSMSQTGGQPGSLALDTLALQYLHACEGWCHEAAGCWPLACALTWQLHVRAVGLTQPHHLLWLAVGALIVLASHEML